MKHGFAYLGLLLMVFASPTALAGLYKCIDAQGNVTYSQTPSEEGNCEYHKTPKTAKPSQSAKSADAPSDKTKAYRDSIKSDAAAEQKSKEVRQDVAKAQELRKQKCAESQKALETYTVFRRFKGEDGEVFYMDDAERQQRVDDAKKGIAEFCD